MALPDSIGTIEAESDSMPAPATGQASGANLTVEGVRPRELAWVASTALVVMLGEVWLAGPEILFRRFFWLDELWTRFIESKPGVWNSMIALKHSGDPTPPTYHLIARAAWGLLGTSPEFAFRALSLVAMWVALVSTYALLRRSFAILPALAAIWALWSNELIIRYGFFARPYALLLAACVGFCLAYDSEPRNRLRWMAISLLAAVICTLHYFGIFALASMVAADACARRRSLPKTLLVMLPAASGPLALLFCLPLVRQFNRGQTMFTYSPPLTVSAAAANIALLFATCAEPAVILVVGWGFSVVLRRLWKSRSEAVEPFARRPMRPLVGLMGLFLVPLILAIFSALTHPVLFDRYMIAGVLAVVPLLALLASRCSKALLPAVIVLIGILSMHEVRFFSTGEARWQAAQEHMAQLVRDDSLPIVAFSFHEGYVLYTYAPELRARLFIADLRTAERPRLSRMMLHIAELMPKWSSVCPDLPKQVSLDELRRMGRFHLLYSEAPVLAEQDANPEAVFSLEQIANRLQLEKVGDLYQVKPN